MFDPRPRCRWTDANEVTVSWDADPNATSYDVLRSDTFNGSYDSIVNVGSGTTSYADTTVNSDPHPQGVYFYKVQVNTAGGPHAGRYSVAAECPDT